MLRRLYSSFIEQTGYFASTSADINFTQGALTGGTFAIKRLESLDWLHGLSPCFALESSQIEIIQEPNLFYDQLLALCTNAKYRISIASLYLGNGNLEKDLVAGIDQNVKQNSDLKVNILIDYARGTRGEINSKKMLQHLVNQSENVLLSLYHTPNLRGLTKKVVPARWNELVGLQHMKVYIADNTVIISGANLSNDYFTNRQDRYIVINDKHLSDFYFNLISKVQEFSLRVTSDFEVGLHPNWKISPYEGTKLDFVAKARELVGEYFTDTFETQRHRQINVPLETADTWIFPLIEMGQLGIHHDSVATKKLFSASLPNSKINLATGYFNLTENYMKTLTTDCKANCNILMAHPNANGFQGAKGPAGGIPAAYSQIAKTFQKTLVASGQAHRVQLFEYQKPNWTYHAKGLWYYLPNSKTPDLTLIGSSNFGERSVNRDLESQICLVTVNDELRQQMQSECDNLYKYGEIAGRELRVRPVPKWVRAVVAIFRNYF